MTNEEQKEYIPSHPLVRFLYEIEKRGNKVSDDALWCGDYLFNFKGDLVGFYVGNGMIDRVVKAEGNGR